MRLNKTEREEFRKRVNILILQMKKSETVNHLEKECHPRQTTNDSISHKNLVC